MWISRVRVNGGFLAGLDVRLAPGLNVVIGPRGAGKTTLLELIRHALGIIHPDAVQARKQQIAAEQLLGSGEVVLDLAGDFGSRHVVVDSRGSGRDPESASAAMMLGQNELEQIASNAASRLHLIDLRAVMSSSSPDYTLPPRLSSELFITATRAAVYADSSTRTAILREDRKELVQQEEQLLARVSRQLLAQRERLRSIESQSLDLDSQLEAFRKVSQIIARAASLQQQVQTELASLTGLDASVALAVIVDADIAPLSQGSEQLTLQLNSAMARLADAGRVAGQRLASLRFEAEPIRAELEAAEEGLGQVTARLRNIDSEIDRLSIEQAELAASVKLQTVLRERRDDALDEIELWQESLYEARTAIADLVSSDLQQNVIVAVNHLADTTAFRETLVGLLQGAGMQYRPLAETLSKRLMPRQLLQFVEQVDIAGLSAASGLALDRAARVIGQLESPDAVSALAGTRLDDSVDFQLLDGRIKSVDELSTGQKCAVTLPVVLTERDRLLILDQPEDHLDNAYLVDNVISALKRRSDTKGQTIVATHNANIPVLGSAEMVVCMASDGERGSVRVAGRFDEPQIVEVITSLMEGGKEAFRARAEFYASHGGNR